MNHVDFTKDLTKWLEDKMQRAKKSLEIAEKEKNKCSFWSDEGGFHREEVSVAKERLETLVEIKVGIEKYSKKISYEEQGK